MRTESNIKPIKFWFENNINKIDLFITDNVKQVEEDRFIYNLYKKELPLETNTENIETIVNEHLELINGIKECRESECFVIINRGVLWYNTLTDAELRELNEWYDAWLDAPDTLIKPDKPRWL